jgi:hypothetical protein
MSAPAKPVAVVPAKKQSSFLADFACKSKQHLKLKHLDLYRPDRQIVSLNSY